jgi:hypothetical protein
MINYTNKKMKPLPALLVFCFLSIAFLHNCSPDDTPIRYPEVPQGLKDWGTFKKGTYWIYQKEGTSLIDSVWVDTLITQEIEADEHGVSRIETNLRQTYDVRLYRYRISTQAQFIAYEQLQSSQGEHAFKCYINKYPLPKQGDKVSSGSVMQITTFDTIYPTYSIGTDTYTNVVRAFNNYNYAFEGDTTYIYTAKNYGIIRKEFPEKKEVWNLVRCNIVK